MGGTTMGGTTTGKCSAKNSRGQPCGCAPLSGSDRCFFHDPKAGADRRQAQSSGGRARHNRSLTTAGAPSVKLETVQDILQGLGGVVNDLQSLENSVSRAGALTRAYQAAGQIIQQVEIETRLQRLEAAIGGDS